MQRGELEMDEEKLLRVVRQAIREELGAHTAKAVTVSEAARRLSFSVRRITRMIESGALLAGDIDGSRRIPLSEIERLLKARR